MRRDEIYFYSDECDPSRAHNKPHAPQTSEDSDLNRLNHTYPLTVSNTSPQPSYIHNNTLMLSNNMMKGEQESNDVQELPKTPDYNDTKRAGFITHSALHNILLKTLYSSLGSQLKTFMFCHSLAQIKKALFFLERRETQSEPLDQSRPDFRSHGVFLMRSSHLFRLDVGDFNCQCFL